MNTYESAHISQVLELFKLILVWLATNASSERSFSFLGPVKFYLRATTGQSRLNHLIILNAYKENFDQLNLKDVAREFIHKNKSGTRISLFGNLLTHFFPMFSLRFNVFKPYDFCSSKYGQFYGSIRFLTPEIHT